MSRRVVFLLASCIAVAIYGLGDSGIRLAASRAFAAQRIEVIDQVRVINFEIATISDNATEVKSQGFDSPGSPVAPAQATVLHLVNGDFIAGDVQASPDPKILRWRSPRFTQPLHFPQGSVSAIHFPISGTLPQSTGEYCFEFGDDDVLCGDLVALTENEIEIDSPRLGRVHLRREQLRRISRQQAGASVYFGPNGLSGWKESGTVPRWNNRPGQPRFPNRGESIWKQSSDAPRWRDEAGHLATDQAGTSLFRDLALPDKAMIEVELSWSRKPDFILSLGVDEREGAGAGSFHFEVWGLEVVVVGESSRDADFAFVQHVGSGEGHLCVRVYLDQTERRLILLSRGGNQLADLNLSGKKAAIRSGIRLTNKNGDIRLDRLRITRWSGLPPGQGQEDRARVHRSDGSCTYGRLTAYDPKSKKFTLRDGATTVLVDHDDVATVYDEPQNVERVVPSLSQWLRGPSLLGKGLLSATIAGSGSRIIRANCRDGSRLSGSLTRIEDGHLTLACPSVKEPVRLSYANIRLLTVDRRDDTPTPVTVAGRAGRLEMDGVWLRGRLVDPSGSSESGALVWRPDLAVSGSPFVGGVTGRIIYHKAPLPAPAGPQVGRFKPAGIGHVRDRRLATHDPKRTEQRPAGEKSLHLRSGDSIPCEVIGIDEKGLTFKTRFADATFVAHDKIKSVDLIAPQDAPQLDQTKRDRLLTLPRMQKSSPPTHLIRSTTGDYLRGRVMEMDDKRLQVEIRLETREIPRERIAQIIWLHPDELAEPKKATANSAATGLNRAQAVYEDGNRLTLVVEKTDHDTISGRNEVLGTCRADLTKVDLNQLLFGAAIEESASKLADHRWKLHHAVEPKFVHEGSGAPPEKSVAGTESPLVGQPATAFKLDRLDGAAFNLADYRGRVVVLDFWATWCGPCMQSMPRTEIIGQEFADRGVELFTVNMEEQPERVKAVLERHKFAVRVLLDRDGAVAAKYAVTAIPQTVVIDRTGKIARVFVGGGKNMADALRKALEELVHQDG
jgi:peroxiredoxin